MLAASRILAELRQADKRLFEQEQTVYAKRVTALSRLIHMGLIPKETLSFWNIRHGINKKIDRKCLPKLRACLGKLRVVTKSPVYVTEGVADTNKLLVTIEGVNFPGIRLDYEKEVTEASKCRVKLVSHPAQTYYAVVCDS